VEVRRRFPPASCSTFRCYGPLARSPPAFGWNAGGLPIAVAGWFIIGLSLVRFLFQRKAIEGDDRRSFVVWDLAIVTFTAATDLAVLIDLLLAA
jgi:hypothetical protein